MCVCVGGGDQGKCERRSDVFVKFKKKKILLLFLFIYLFWGGGGGGVQGRCEGRGFCGNSKEKLEGVWGGGGGSG